MVKIKLIMKGILLWSTFLTSIIFITGIDSIYENGYLFYFILFCPILWYTCYKYISEKECEILTLHKWVSKYLNEE